MDDKTSFVIKVPVSINFPLLVWDCGFWPLSCRLQRFQTQLPSRLQMPCSFYLACVKIHLSVCFLHSNPGTFIPHPPTDATTLSINVVGIRMFMSLQKLSLNVPTNTISYVLSSCSVIIVICSVKQCQCFKIFCKLLKTVKSRLLNAFTIRKLLK